MRAFGMKLPCGAGMAVPRISSAFSLYCIMLSVIRDYNSVALKSQDPSMEIPWKSDENFMEI
jgi:putative salt-induced outer membrane protein YdiY